MAGPWWALLHRRHRSFCSRRLRARTLGEFEADPQQRNGKKWAKARCCSGLWIGPRVWGFAARLGAELSAGAEDHEENESGVGGECGEEVLDAAAGHLVPVPAKPIGWELGRMVQLQISSSIAETTALPSVRLLPFRISSIPPGLLEGTETVQAIRLPAPPLSSGTSTSWSTR